jgi:Ca2+-binding EF-hand superfamily protein
LTILEELGVHTQSLDFPEFLALFQAWEMKEGHQSREHNTTFDLIDRSGKGYVTLEELRKFLHSIGESMSDTDFEKFMQESDIVNEDGVVTREAFLQLFQQHLKLERI